MPEPCYLLARPFAEEIFRGYQKFSLSVIADRKKNIDIHLSKILRDLKVQTVLSPHESMRSSIFAKITGAPIRCGFKNNPLSFLYTHTVRRDPQLHITLNFLKLLEPLNFKFSEMDSFPNLLARPYEDREELLEEKYLKNKKPYVLLFPSTRWQTKNWTVQGFVEVSKIFVKRGYNVLLMGSREDRKYVEAVYEMMLEKEGTYNLAGETTLEEMLYLVEKASLVICGDSAPMHIAETFSTPLVAIFGPTSPSLGFRPRRKTSKIVEVELECRPCSPHGPSRCPLGHHLCMKNINPEMVLKASEEVIKEP